MKKDYRFGCTGKIPYFTEAEARTQIRRMLSVKGGSQKVYICRYIENGKRHWHITSMSHARFKSMKFKKPKLQSI